MFVCFRVQCLPGGTFWVQNSILFFKLTTLKIQPGAKSLISPLVIRLIFSEFVANSVGSFTMSVHYKTKRSNLINNQERKEEQKPGNMGGKSHNIRLPAVWSLMWRVNMGAASRPLVFLMNYHFLLLFVGYGVSFGVLCSFCETKFHRPWVRGDLWHVCPFWRLPPPMAREHTQILSH